MSRGQTMRREKAFRAPIWRCGGKVKYSKKDALTAKNMREKDGAGNLRIYPCGICAGWHLTHQV